jgi:RNA-directed DNA polymerase
MTTQAQKTTPLCLGLAPLKSLRDLQYRLGVNRATLTSLAKSFSENYHPFRQAKVPKPHASVVKPIKFREIDNPCPALKAIQSKILHRLLGRVTLPHFVFGAVRGVCVREHAREHLGASTVIKMDITSYYPSITNRQIHYVWSSVLGCSPRIAHLLTKLTTFDGHLPQGAPTSPALANIFLASIYGPVLEACKAENVVVTAWVDDLIFSGDRARVVMNIVRATLADNGLKLSSKKTHILNGRTAKVVTGVRLGKDKLRGCKIKLRDIRAGIHNLECGRFTDLGQARDIQRLRGQINYIKSHCLSDSAHLSARLDRLERQLKDSEQVGARCPLTMDLPFHQPTCTDRSLV